MLSYLRALFFQRLQPGEEIWSLLTRLGEEGTLLESKQGSTLAQSMLLTASMLLTPTFLFRLVTKIARVQPVSNKRLPEQEVKN